MPKRRTREQHLRPAAEVRRLHGDTTKEAEPPGNHTNHGWRNHNHASRSLCRPTREKLTFDPFWHVPCPYSKTRSLATLFSTRAVFSCYGLWGTRARPRCKNHGIRPRTHPVRPDLRSGWLLAVRAHSMACCYDLNMRVS